MNSTTQHIAKRQARRWAHEQHAAELLALPDELRNNINWLKVAKTLGIKTRISSGRELERHLRRIIDYLYDDEASDYQILERYLQKGHIFESIHWVARWLARNRAHRC